MNIDIKCITTENISICTCHVYIYNDKKQLIYKGNTNKFGILSFKAPKYGIYKIIVTSPEYPFILCKTVLINGNICHIIPFVFTKHSFKKHHNITFILTDENYKNLPIMKGEITICNKK